MPASTDWNPLVKPANRVKTTKWNDRRPKARVPTHIVLHVTGTDDLASVKKTFTTSVSAHYLVAKDGQLYQFVPDAGRAWHSGIEASGRALYDKGRATWTKYLRYFAWYTGYPKDAVYLGADLNPVWDKSEATFVARADGQPWPAYAYFAARWGNREQPVNYEVDPDPNNYAIGIEILGMGAKTNDPKVYTPAMFDTLRTLLLDLSTRYGIPLTKGRVVGHEDVNPVWRFGWDPAPGFDWAQVYNDD